jgi:hypothetical protein
MYARTIITNIANSIRSSIKAISSIDRYKKESTDDINERVTPIFCIRVIEKIYREDRLHVFQIGGC